MNRIRRCVASAGIAATVLLLPMGARADFSVIDAATTLEIFGDSGADLIAEISLDILSDRSAIGAYCSAAGAASLQQKLAIVVGISAASTGAPAGLNGLFEEQFGQCCRIFAAAPVDKRITYGSKLAVEARRAFTSDREISLHFTALIGSCDDDVLDRSFRIALGNDRIGLFIAHDDGYSAAIYTPASRPADNDRNPDFD